MRSILHYLFAGVVMTLYGSEVCPFLDSLDLGHFFLILLAATALAVGVRPVLVKHTVLGRDPRHQPRLQFLLDLGLLAVVGLGVGLFNGVAFGFPWHSGAKILAGFVLTGFFAATDLALQRERTVAADLARRGLHLTLDDRFFPMTRKFVLLASVCAASAFVVTFLIIVQDLSWLRFQDEISGLLLVWSRQLAWLHDAAAPRYWTGARLTVVIEVGFIAGLMLGYVLNLILSYSRNLRLLLDNETRVLERVHRGKFDAQVPVATNDEFGVIAVRTNEMIRGLKERTERLELTQDVTIVTLASLAETRDNETGGHIRRTQHYVRLLAEQLRRDPAWSALLDEETVELLFKSAPLHDIGKVGVPDAILLKPGRLTDAEWEEMKRHTWYGHEALQVALDGMGPNSFLALAQEIAHTHHERWDGRGYPQGLAGEAIPPSGRLMALADVYDALISRRVYKEPWPHPDSRREIAAGSGTQFDPRVVEAFLAREEDFVAIARRYRDSN